MRAKLANERASGMNISTWREQAALALALAPTALVAIAQQVKILALILSTSCVGHAAHFPGSHLSNLTGRGEGRVTSGLSERQPFPHDGSHPGRRVLLFSSAPDRADSLRFIDAIANDRPKPNKI